MSSITRAEIRNFLIDKKGYLKKSSVNVAKAMWKNRTSGNLPKTNEGIKKELALIREVQTDLRAAKSFIISKEDSDIIDIYNKIIEDKNKPKRRLFFDIEVSPNIVLSWRIGRKVNLSHDDILQERAIICICWKWENEEQVYSLKWLKGDDMDMLKKFSKIMNSADEIVGQNSDSFDIKWVRTRCMLHGIPLTVKFNSLDTLKMARAGFYLNANRLDYMGKFMGFGGKIKTDYDLWKNILLKNDPKAMHSMVEYCKEDVRLLEKIYHKLQDYSPVRKFRYKP